MPPLIGFSEVLRDLEAYEGRFAAESNLDEMLGTLAMLRYFLGGAERVDIDCAAPAARWRRLWERFLER